MSNNKYVCPECGSNVIAWADIDAQITFNVTKNGNLTKQKIENLFQDDGRCGVKCSECDWEMYDISDEDSPYFQLADNALSAQGEINLFTAKRG